MKLKEKERQLKKEALRAQGKNLEICAEDVDEEEDKNNLCVMVDNIPATDEDDDMVDEDYEAEEIDRVDYDSRIEKINEVFALQEVFTYLQ